MNTPGKFLGLKVNGAFVACETNCSISFDVNMLAASAVDSGGWKEFIAGIRGWQVTVDANLILAAVASDVKAIITTGLMNRLPMFIQFSTRPSVEIQMILSGAVLLASGSITAPAKGNATWTVSLQGTGALQTTYHDFSLLIDALPSAADYPVVVNEDV